MRTKHFTQQTVGTSWIRLMAVLLPVLMALLPSTAWADDQNDDTVVLDGVSYHVLRNASDWTRFIKLVKDAAGESDVNAIMDADFTVTEMVGYNITLPFRGIFNGNGHTLNVEINDGAFYTAPFRSATEATFRDLHVTGHVSGARHCAGLVGFCGLDATGCTITFERVWVSTHVTAINIEDYVGKFLGGFTGHTRKNTIKMTDCRFDGKLQSMAPDYDSNMAGAFFGWGEPEGSWIAHRLYEMGSPDNCRYSIGYESNNGGTSWGHNSKSSSIYAAGNWGGMESEQKNITNQNDVVNKMNSEKEGKWVLVDGKAVPNIKHETLDSSFECYDVVPGTESGEEGMLKIPFSCDQVVKWIDASYIDENGNKKDLPRLTLPPNSYNGFLNVPATEPHNNLQMTIKLMIDDISYTYDPKSDAVMHNPRNLKSEVLAYSKNSLTDAGAVLLQWETKNPKYNDVMEGDQFIVLRSLTGNAEDMTSIGSVVLDDTDSLYSYKDSTLISALTAEHIDASTGFPPVKYWVVRASAQQLWGMDSAKNPTVVNVQPKMAALALLEPTNVKAEWSNQEEYKAKVAWNYKTNDENHNYAWDPRVKMTMEVKFFRLDGELIDSILTPLTDEQIQAGEIELTLSRSCVNYQITLLIDDSQSPLRKGTGKIAVALPNDKFYHENLGRIDKESLAVRELRTSVLLTWANVDDEPVDYYEVWRRDVKVADFERIATQLTEMQYEDKTTSPVHQYEYFIRGVNDCEGKKYEDTQKLNGSCSQTGTMEGYLRFADGTGIPGININITLPDGQSWKAMTDESGLFRMTDLPYVNGTETTYTVMPSLNGYTAGSQPVTFSTTPGSNLVKGIVFVVDKSIKFSGYVQYNGTSIPVQGVSFIVDGYEVHNAAGKVVSDHEGKYTFRMLEGEHTIQAVKDGHVFFRDGFYHERDNDPDTKKTYNFTADKASIYFYDDTRVKLIGRICGGKDQGAIPLGNSLSRNNLGDDLQMVLTLEGDNASRLVWDILDTKKKERDEVFTHKAHDKKHNYQTKVHTTLNRMVVTPDVHTGEYEVLLPPVKWKIQQITAKGYVTLFQDGQVGDVIDLSDSLTLHTDHYEGSWMNAEKVEVKAVDVEYHAQYNRIYHSPVIIDYKQVGIDPFDYYGDQYYSFKNVTGDKQKLTLAYGVRKQNWPAGKRDSLETKYTFGYPVFSIDKKYPVKISATERYYYNNNTKSDTVDIIKLSGGEVTIHNGMVSSTHKDVVELDSVGEATYSLEAAQTPYLLTGPDALRTVSMTLEMDGTHYEATPLRAYVLNIQQLKGAKDILTYSTPQLLDILRDPPGGMSKATISKGSTLKYSYQMDLSWAGGMSFEVSGGSALNSFTGVVAAPMGAGGVAGINNTASADLTFSLDLIWSGTGQRAFSYTMTTNEDISTSTDKMMVGANADLYIGMEQNIVVKPATAIRAIPDSVFIQAGGLLASGRMVEIAKGLDESGKTLHLVRDEVVTYGPHINSTFIHSQDYILKQLIPSLTNQCRSLIFTGTESEAQTQADATGKPVYLSLVPVDDEEFGVAYKMITPTGSKETFADEVDRYHKNLLTWIGMIAQNEKEKLGATDLVKNFEVDGGSSISYGESFTSDYSRMNSYISPITLITTNYFNSDVSAGSSLLGIAEIVGQVEAKLLTSILKKKTGGTNTSYSEGKDKDGKTTVDVKFFGTTWKFAFTPVFSFNVIPKHTESTSYNRKESFTIGMDKRSHLSFDVYRVKTSTDDLDIDNPLDVFYNNNFYDQVCENESYLKREMDMDDVTYARSFVYRTRAGATCRPYEGERTTNFYNPGTVIDERTKKIENPIIKMDKQSVSGVPFGEPARFKLYLANESEQPEAAYIYFNLYQNETSNPDGAKLMMDGMPLTGDGRTVEIHPGQVTEKTLEVYASEKFDYQNLRIGMISQGDALTYQEVAFDVHYLQTAGAVAITTPGDKWIMNCDAPEDSEKGWYLPIIIGGFDKNQHNFDHIEFQYKESTRGDDYWTNLCGYYADSTLYAAASGTKEMIPENGNITTRFFGEGQVIEKAYDLRAVLFCRNGNAFLTNSSKVLSGVKDTRRPQLFGNTDPKDGVLLAGDNIVFHFSEDIEYNYLQATTNFEVNGETNETNIQEAPSLRFSGTTTYAQTEARRNFADKSVTIEVMIKPDDTGKDMPIFSHGRNGKQLQLWLTADKRLRAVVDDQVLEGTTELSANSFQRVALVLDNEQKKLFLYGNELEGTKDSVTYSGYGCLIFGATNQKDVSKRTFYQGNMLQARVWNRALDINQLNSYGNQLLTGYEMGLTDYYPMSEGQGDYAIDLAQGAHLQLFGADWAQPDGMSLKFDKTEEKAIKGIKLKEQFIQRTDEQDYTLMFWFKTNNSGHGTLLANGSGRKSDVAAINKFFIGFEGSTLKYRSYGREYVLGDDWDDDRWHNYAMTVNRAHQVASIYIDSEMRAQFATDSLGGMTGDFYLGNMVWKEEGLENDKVHQENALTGYIDGIALFEQALPKNLIKRYTSKALGGAEKGLITYVDFEHQERQKTGDLVLQPYVLNKRIKFDNDGNPSEEHDSVFVDPVADILARVDLTTGAPMQAYEELRNLNFSYVGRDNQLLVNLDELASRINKRTIYVTVSDIPDRNGNFMASPATAAVFVDLNPLRWEKKIYKAILQFNKDEDHTFDIDIQNNSGAAHTYVVSNLPKWLTVDTPTDVVEAKSERRLTFTISKDTNVGSYDDIIYLTDENGLAEPLALDITVEGQAPDWIVPEDMKQYSMSIVARVEIENDIVTDSRDKVAAFDANGRCMGVGNINFDATSSESLVYLSVYDSTMVASPLFFRMWHYETGKTMALTSSELVEFKPESFVGTTKNPLLLQAGDLYIQYLYLMPGWNWVSLNVLNANYRDVKRLLSLFQWKEGDMLSDENHQISLLYQYGEWLSNKGSKTFSDMTVSVDESYRVKVSSPAVLEISGTILKTKEDRTIKVQPGWNSIGYTPLVNLPISTALADYLDEVEDGDIVKSKKEFAIFSEGANGSRGWKGDLKYMKPGEGYMLYRQRKNNTSFVYPYYAPDANFFEETGRRASIYAGNMSLTAIAEGIELQEGDRLVAYTNGEVVGEASLNISTGEKYLPLEEAGREVFFLSIAGYKKAPLSFTIERDGDIIATTGEIMTYEENAISGTYNAPTKISFAHVDQLPQHGWYTVQGIKLDKRPTQSGVYIYNGRKQVIK